MDAEDRDSQSQRLFHEMLQSKDEQTKDVVNFFMRVAYEHFFTAKNPATSREPKLRVVEGGVLHYTRRQMLALPEEGDERERMFTHITHCHRCRRILARLISRPEP